MNVCSFSTIMMILSSHVISPVLPCLMASQKHSVKFIVIVKKGFSRWPRGCRLSTAPKPRDAVPNHSTAQVQSSRLSTTPSTTFPNSQLSRLAQPHRKPIDFCSSGLHSVCRSPSDHVRVADRCSWQGSIAPIQARETQSVWKPYHWQCRSWT